MAQEKIGSNTDAKVPTPKEAKELVPNKNVGEDSGKGQTSISDQVVAKIAGLAVREIPGVYALGGSAARALGTIRSSVGMDDNIKQGVSVEVGQTQAAIDLTAIIEYPYPIHEVCDKIRESVLNSVEGLVGLEVTEVNIKVVDVHVESEDDDDDKKEEEKEVRVK